ncbi:MAG: preprotein translocase subunit SecG [Alphaproteobacteria bacterium]|nr:preprotein translocase subunit SecG [Alphaproteobacteria bacterium]
MFSILLVLLIIVAVLMTGLILLQKSEGSGMSGSAAASMFGGVLTGSAAGNFLTKTTAWLATIFFILCILLSLVVAKTDAAKQHQSELRQELTTETAPAQSEPIPATETTEPVPAKVSE